MKFAALIVLGSAAVAFASPAAVSLNRATRVTRDLQGNPAVAEPCVICPCKGFTGKCECVKNGCCCPHPPA